MGGGRGEGYGSEDSLLRYLSERTEVVNGAIASVLAVPSSALAWPARPRASGSGDREFRGLEFLDSADYKAARAAWRVFWPTTGRQPSWDAIGTVGDVWLLVEAKANQPEFTSPPSQASPESRKQIERALAQVKRALGVHRYFPWTGTYYQYANRLAILWFLREQGVSAHLVLVYFTGDRFPDGTPCPASQPEWEQLIEARRLTLGLPQRHALSEAEHHVYLPAFRGGVA